MFESLDDDKWDRSVQPVYLTNRESGARNKINSYMDHVWDGFYTGQLRLSRFPAVLEATGYTTLKYSGTPPNHQRITLQGEAGSMIIAIPYPNTGSFNLLKDGNIVPFTDWDEDIGNYAAVQGKFCGENRYVGVENFFEFYLTPGCTIEIIPRDAIQSYVRLEWTLDEFYADGGVVSFADRVAAALGIHASEIKTVAVYEGSVVIQFFIDADYDACEVDDDEIERRELTEEEVEDIEQDCRDEQLSRTSFQLNRSLSANSIWLGAPILDAITDGKIVIWNTDEDTDTSGGNNSGNKDSNISGGDGDDEDEEEIEY